MLSFQVKEYIDRSVLCWLATSSEDNMPNVSPKEIFTYQDDFILVANIASPQTVDNIKANKNVCISFIDIFIQKGVQLKGTAEIVEEGALEYEGLAKGLLEMTGGKFPFNSITKIVVNKTKPIVAPRYWIYPDTKEEDQIESAKKTYGVS